MLRLAASVSKVLPAAVLSTPRILSRIVTPNFIPHENFSTDAAAATAAGNQTDRGENVKVSIPELKSKQLSLLQLKTPPAAPADFPFTPEEEFSTERSAYLSRKFNGELILVAIYKPENIQYFTKESGCCGQSVELMVSITKENDEDAAFDVLMCRKKMLVRLISVMNDATLDVDAEGEFQSGLQEYLETRGIEPRYADYLHKYMVWWFVQKPMIEFIKE